MWWVGSKPHDVYLGTRGFAVCMGTEKLVAHSVSELEAALTALSAWLKESKPKQALRLWLSGGLCRPFLLHALPGVSGEDEWRRVAAAMAPAQCGLRSPCRIWLSPPRKGADNRVAVALEEPLLQRLQSIAATSRQKHCIVSIRPWWSELLRQAMLREPGLAALAVHDCDALTTLAGESGRFEFATTLSPVLDVETAESALARTLLTIDSSPAKALCATLQLDETGASDGRAPLAVLTGWSR